HQRSLCPSSGVNFVCIVAFERSQVRCISTSCRQQSGRAGPRSPSGSVWSLYQVSESVTRWGIPGTAQICFKGGERRRFAMPIPLRADFDAPCLRAIARGTKDAAQTRRLLALAAVYDGARRTEAAAIGGVTLQIVRDWVMKFNAAGLDGLIARKAPGQPPKLNEAHRAALRAAIESGPTAAIDGVVRWRLVDLCQWI